MKLFLYLVALLTGVAGSQGAEAAPVAARPQACATAMVGALLLQQVTEAREAVRAGPAPEMPLIRAIAGEAFAIKPFTIVLKADRARE